MEGKDGRKEGGRREGGKEGVNECRLSSFYIPAMVAFKTQYTPFSSVLLESRTELSLRTSSLEDRTRSLQLSSSSRTVSSSCAECGIE